MKMLKTFRSILLLLWVAVILVGCNTVEKSDSTEKDSEVTIYVLSASQTRNEIYSLVSDYAKKHSNTVFKTINPEKNPEFIDDFGGVWPEEDMSVLVVSENRYKLLKNSDLYYYYNNPTDMRYSPTEYEYYLYMFQQYCEKYPGQGYEETLATFKKDTILQFDVKNQLDAAVNYVLLDRISIIYTTRALDESLTDNLWKHGYEIRNLQSLQNIPNDCDLLVLQAAKDIGDLEKKALDTYLKNGGKLFLATYYGAGDMKNLGSVLEQYGMDFLEQTHLLMEGDQNYLSASQNSQTYLMRAHIRQHGATGAFTGSFWLDLMNEGVHVIDIKDVEGVTVTPWLQTSEKGFPAIQVGNSSEKGEEGVYTFGAIAEKGDTRIIWVATPSALSAAVDSQSGGDNFELVISAFCWMTDSK